MQCKKDKQNHCSFRRVLFSAPCCSLTRKCSLYFANGFSGLDYLWFWFRMFDINQFDISALAPEFSSMS